MGHIFISYSRTDRGFVDDLVRDLTKRGIVCWLDRHKIEGGQLWRAQLATAIRQCDACLAVLSPEAVASGNVKRELAVAESNHRRIIPLRYKACTLPPDIELMLGNVQWIDFVELIYEDAVARLLQCLREDQAPDKSTPMAVWMIGGFYFISGLYYLTAVALYFLGAVDLIGEQTSFFRTLPVSLLLIGIIGAMVNVAAALVLLQLRIQAFHLFVVSLVLQMPYSAWHLFSITDNHLRIGTAVNYGLLVAVTCYIYKLRQEHRLNGFHRLTHGVATEILINSASNKKSQTLAEGHANIGDFVN